MTHDPLCGLSQPCDDETPEHGYCSIQHGEFCIHCHQWCICDVIAKACEDALADAVQRVEAYEYISTIGVTLSSVVPKATVIALIKGEQP